MDTSRCVVLVPAAQGIEPHCELGLRQLEALGYPVRRWYGFANIDIIRSRMATAALNDGFEELFWIDADIAFEPSSVERLRNHNVPIVAGLYPTKIEKKLTSLLLPGTSRVKFGVGGGLFEIRYAATGFLLTRRRVYVDVQRQLKLPVCDRRLGRPTIPFFLPLIVADGDEALYLSEDFSFCERARQCGYRIFADSSVRLQHLGTYGYGWEDLGPGLTRHDSCEVVFGPDSKPPAQ